MMPTFSRLAARTRDAARALRGFLAGFTGIPAARPAPCCPDAARRALTERAARRPTCC